MFEELVKDMLEKGLIKIAQQEGVLEANKLYQELTILNYTNMLGQPDAVSLFLSKYRYN